MFGHNALGVIAAELVDMRHGRFDILYELDGQLQVGVFVLHFFGERRREFDGLVEQWARVEFDILLLEHFNHWIEQVRVEQIFVYE